jgi:hypothetical protein
MCNTEFLVGVHFLQACEKPHHKLVNKAFSWLEKFAMKERDSRTMSHSMSD